MSDARDPGADDTDLISPDGSSGKPIESDAADPTVGEDEPSIASTLDLEPPLRGPVVAETFESASPNVDGISDTTSPGVGPTLDMTVSGGSKEPQEGRRAEAETRLIAALVDSADDVTHDHATAEVSTQPDGVANRPSGRIGVEVPGYEILAEIGRGGMGVVYKARHLRLDRTVALKMILAGAHASDDQIARFLIEARAVARIQHPGIVQIYEDGEIDGLPYFSLEFVSGGSLARFINGKPQAPRVAATMVMALCRAVAEAHARGIIHRDLKPANVLLTLDHHPKITDFGLAKQLEGDSQQTRSGAIMGTPSYMSPEQAWGQTREIGPHSDQYALGAILYEMIVGRPPFQGATPLETLELVRSQEPVPPTRLQPRTPTDLETICLKALQKDPARRFPDAGAMAEDLRRFLNGEPIVARPVSAPERLWRWFQRNPRVAGLATAVVLMGITITAGSAAFAVTLRQRNADLSESYKKENAAKEVALTNERAANVAKDEAIAARNAETIALKNERQAREKAEALVQGAFAQTRNALEAQRVLSVLLDQRLRSIPGTQGIREEIIRTTMNGLDATMSSLEQLGTVARDREGFALGLRVLAGVNQRAGQIAMNYGRYDDTARYFRRMEELSEQLAAAEPAALEPLKVKASVKATLGEFQMDRIGDAKKAVDFFDQALALRRQWLAREPTNDEARRGVANMLGALANSRLRLGDPAGARALYREEIELRDRFSPALANQIEVRREHAGLRDKLGDLSVSLGDPEDGRKNFEAALKLRREIAADQPDETQAHRDVLLSLQRLGTHELIYTRDPKAALVHYRTALDGFLERLKADGSSVRAKMDAALAQYYVATAELRAGYRDAAMAHYRECRDIREELAKDPKTKLNSLDLMLALARTGDHARASEIAEGMIKDLPLDARIYFHAACGFALSAGAAASMPATAVSTQLARHYTDRALDALRLALKHGWRSAEEVATDPDLDPIRADPGFVSLLKELRKMGP
jgi:serine/threonine-protein kinase